MINKLKQYLKTKLKDVDTLRSYMQLRNNGVSPEIIYDVGAYKGDYAKLVHKLWPEAVIYCFEVLPECSSALSKLPRVIHVEALAGREDLSVVPFYSIGTASSVLEEHWPQNFPVMHVPMMRLDTFAAATRSIPDLLKIDTQGYEFQVLQGCGKMLEKVSVIHVELNLIDIHKEVVLASDVIAFLHDQGFVPYDITELHRRPLDQALWQVDILFCRQDAPLRSDKRWSA